ncbi:MAG: nucleotidyltransferase domain-containing protein [Clostridium celatum]|uniref:nucleotidyltransferase domain-containing protein n=1 Tax=uncultured Clostridium sp. TaxID=59620 RepID=UPI0025F2525C|nr:nucleotidyltransferase domain-containing protein [uncultured Clostridium sp.]MDU4883070.1 nucleotidyltransferase domain-containing protein [Clostridium celatum]MDU5261385.1 nucleotidyltransferase domain-containing protein [Clostridium celatum]MDU7076210.1 nucleotidyltransferase domain-containing protein [Clostridium celatum]
MFDSCNIKNDVKYCLDKQIRNEIIKVRDTCIYRLKNADILLFGSIAKGKYRISSDIDILILVDQNKTISELRKLRHELEDDIDNLNLSRNVDIKLYNKDRYIELSREISFEQDIVKDLIDIRWWNYG